MTDYQSIEILKFAKETPDFNRLNIATLLKCDEDHAEYSIRALSKKENGLIEPITKYSGMNDEWGNAYLEETGDYRITPKGKAFLANAKIETRKSNLQNTKSNVALSFSALALLVSLLSNLDKIQTNLKLLADWLTILLSKQ